MAPLHLICLVVALVLFAIAAFWSPATPPRVNLIAAGLFFATLAGLVP